MSKVQLEFAPGVVVQVGPKGMKFLSDSPVSIDGGGSTFTSPRVEPDYGPTGFLLFTRPVV